MFAIKVQMDIQKTTMPQCTTFSSYYSAAIVKVRYVYNFTEKVHNFASSLSFCHKVVYYRMPSKTKLALCPRSFLHVCEKKMEKS